MRKKNYSTGLNQWSSKPRKRLLWGFLTILVLGGFLASLEITNKTDIFHKQKAVSGTIPSTSTPSTPVSEDKDSSVPPNDNATAPESPKQGDSTTSTPSVGTAPVAPYGNFVSNHNPNLDGHPAPSSVNSVCNTTPGAQCYIEFTNQDGVVKALETKTTDSNGAVYWKWDIKAAGFSAGSWKIKVIATLNGQTTRTDDAQNLEVGP